MAKNKAQSLKETEFALSALMEIPQQYKATIELNLLGRRNGYIPERFPLPPPMRGGSSSYNSPKPSRLPSFKPSVPPHPTEGYHVRSSPVPPPTSSASDNQVLLKSEIYLEINQSETLFEKVQNLMLLDLLNSYVRFV